MKHEFMSTEYFVTNSCSVVAPYAEQIHIVFFAFKLTVLKSKSTFCVNESVHEFFFVSMKKKKE